MKEKQKNKETYFSDLLNVFLKSDYKTINDFVRCSGCWKGTSQALLYNFRTYVPLYNNNSKSRTNFKRIAVLGK